MDGVELYYRYDIRDYLSGSFKPTQSFVFDFTTSNGVIDHKKSLHYRKYPSKTPYFRAAMAMEKLFRDISQQEFPFYGLCAKRMHQNEENRYFFPVSWKDSELVVKGLNGLLDAYQNCL